MKIIRNLYMPGYRLCLKITVTIKLLITTLFLTTLSANASVVAAGASLPSALYNQWSYSFQKQYQIQVNYQSVGSSSGVRQVRDRIVDFGASDKPVSPKDLQKYKLIQIPAVSTGLVLVANLGSGLKNDIILDSETLYKIWTSQILYWDDPAIQALNPDVKLPHIYIALIYRADGSGTTYNFTKYLASINPEFTKLVGVGNNVNWGKGISAKGNEGISFMVPRIKGAIGYLEYGFSKQIGLLPVKIKNKNGVVVAATQETIANAIAEADWSTDQPNLLNVKGDNAWPIVLVSYILIPEETRPATAEVLQFLKHGLMDSSHETAQLFFVPLKSDLASSIVASLYKKFQLPQPK